MHNQQAEYPSAIVLNRAGDTEGKGTGGTRDCQMEGCRGTRIGVRWPDGKLTFPCSKGLKNLPNGKLQII